MKIVTVSTLGTGGGGVAARNLHTAFCDAGYDAQFVSLIPADDLPNSAPLSYGTVGNMSKWLVELFAYWGSLISPDGVREQCCELFSDATTVLQDFIPESLFNDADIIHIHWASGILFSPFLFENLQGKRVVFTLHDLNPFTGGCHYAKSCINYKDKCGNCPLLKESSPTDVSAGVFSLKKALYASLNPAVISPSQWLQAKAGESALLGCHPIRHIANAHPVDFYVPISREEIRTRYGISPDDFILLCGAEYVLNPRKGGDVFEKFLALLQSREDLSNIKVLTFGSGEFKSKNTKHLGMVEKETLRDLYNIADVYVHPSLLDNLSNTLCEAQCCGTPVIAFDVGGNSEAFVPGKTGMLAEDVTSEALLEAVEAMVKLSHEKRNAMRSEARMYAETKFASNVVALKHIEFYNELINSSIVASEIDQEIQNKLNKQNISGLYKLMDIALMSREQIRREIKNNYKDDLIEICQDEFKHNLDDKVDKVVNTVDKFRGQILYMDSQIAQLHEEISFIKKNMSLKYILSSLMNKTQK